MTLELIKYLLKRKYKVDLILRIVEGSLLRDIPDCVRLFAADPIVLNDRYLDSENCIDHVLMDRIIQLCESTPIKVSDLFRAIIPNWPFGFSVLPRRQNRYIQCAHLLSKYFLKYKPDIIFTVFPYDYLVSFLALRVSRSCIPIICSIRNHIRPNNLNFQKARDFKILKRLLRKANRVHAISKGIASEITQLNLCSIERVTTIYNPSNRKEISNLARESPPKENSWFGNESRRKHKIILAAGRLAPQKNHILLLEAFLLVIKHFEAKLVIIGEGKERKNLETRIEEMGLSDMVSLPGWQRNPFSFMSRSDVFVLSSDYEGFGNVIVEAMECGCSIVSTNCLHGPSEILEDGKHGILVPTNDDAALAQGIMRLLAGVSIPPQAVAKNRAAQFTMQEIGPQFEQLIQNEIDSYR